MKTNRIFRRIGRLTAMGATLAAVACTGSFEEYNTKPYRPSDEDLEGDNVGVGILFPSMMEWMMHVQVNASQYHDVLLGDELGGYASAVKSYQGQNIATYNPSDDFNDPLFENTFSNFYGNYFQIMTETGGEGPVYELSRIIRVASMLRVTDAYGPIPYSKMQNGTFSVPYDSQRDVYMAMIDDLDEAMESLHTFAAAGGGSLLSDFDISTYKGDVSLWIQFANTLKLRMAIRMSGVEPEAQRIAEEAVAAIDTYGLIDANAENLQFTLTSRRNPYYTQATSESWQDLRSNANITMYMNAYEDPRRSSYFSKSGYDETYAGVRSGIENVLPTTYASFSYPLFAETDPVPVMYAAESWFLRAEGALLGWAMGDTPENLYNTGVKTSFEQWGCSSSYEGYIASTLTPRLAYTDPAGKHDQPNFGQAVSVKWADDGHELERIITQKWIANHMIGHEAWADFRRTGYPRMMMAVNNLGAAGGMWGSVDGDRGMRRLHYPVGIRQQPGERARRHPTARRSRRILHRRMVGQETELTHEPKNAIPMKKNIIRLSALLLAAAPLAACDDWTEPEAQDFTQRFPESYYENLRAYKASDHSITFGWFGGWDPKAATTGSSLMGIPDSVDLVANWASFYLTEEQKAEAKAVKAKKGTDVVVTLLLMDIGRTITPDEVTAGITGKDEIARAMRHYWGWSDDADAAEIEAAIRKYASAVVDVVLENEYTGLDLDYEPSYSDHLGNIVNDLPSQGDIYAGTTPAERTFWFVDECGRRLGPKSGSGKLLIVDGEVAKMPVGTIEYFDYYILQTYSLSYQSNLDTRLGAVISAFSGVLDEKTITNRTIVCENFEPEALWKNGGSTYVLPDGSTTNSLHGMATWQPYTGYRKGGFGAYQMQNDFKNDCYKYYREAIHAMNELENANE